MGTVPFSPDSSMVKGELNRLERRQGPFTRGSVLGPFRPGKISVLVRDSRKG